MQNHSVAHSATSVVSLSPLNQGLEWAGAAGGLQTTKECSKGEPKVYDFCWAFRPPSLLPRHAPVGFGPADLCGASDRRVTTAAGGSRASCKDGIAILPKVERCSGHKGNVMSSKEFHIIPHIPTEVD